MKTITHQTGLVQQDSFSCWEIQQIRTYGLQIQTILKGISRKRAYRLYVQTPADFQHIDSVFLSLESINLHLQSGKVNNSNFADLHVRML